jgi:D-arginine dehydrogenase
VRRVWACLRTFAPNRDFHAGADARVPGLFWVAGLGGRGMTCGLALGERVAQGMS